MKYLYSFLIVALCISFSFSQKTIYTDGQKVFGPCGDEIVLRGVNYAPFNWGYSPNQQFIDEIALTGANCVRIVWYIDAGGAQPNAVYQDSSKLDEVLKSCIDNNLIPILELHDQTCNPDTSLLIQKADYYLQGWVFNLIEKYEHSLIINIFNEALHIRWATDPVAAAENFFLAYTTIIHNLREEGIKVPLMIDGSDCGTNLWALGVNAPRLVAEDELSNLIFSTHAYWADYANEPSEMDAIIAHALRGDFPLVIGELANVQDGNSACEFVLNYEYLLGLCKKNNIGWMVWGWDHDHCPSRQMSSDGLFANLTTFGEDMVHNADYGLLVDTPHKSEYLTNGLQCVSTSNRDFNEAAAIEIFPNPASRHISINSNMNISHVVFLDVLGRTEIVHRDHNLYAIPLHTKNGVTMIEVFFEDGTSKSQLIVVQK